MKNKSFYIMDNKNRQNSNLIFELVSKAKKGDKSAFDQIYEHHIVPIFRYIYFRVKSREDAEDLTQTVFLKAWNAIPCFQKQANPFSSWLYKIAKNTVIDYYKKKQEITLNKAIEDLKQIKDEESDLAEIIEEKERAKIIRQTIYCLSEDQQEVIILKFIESLSNKEIAKLLGKSEDAVRALQYRGLKALRGKLEKSNLL
jgi:RNA polymerase sigma-70 factor (ECF subfamily)